MTDDIEKIEIKDLNLGMDEAGVDKVLRDMIEEAKKEEPAPAENTLHEAPAPGTKEESEAYVKDDKPAERPISPTEKSLQDLAKDEGLEVDEKISKLIKKLSDSIEGEKKNMKETLDSSLAELNLRGANEEDLNSVIAPLKEQALYKRLGLNETQEKMLTAVLYSTQKHKPVDRVAPVAAPAQRQTESDNPFTLSMLNGDNEAFIKAFRAEQAKLKS